MNTTERRLKVPLMTLLILGFFSGTASCNETSSAYAERDYIAGSSDNFESYSMGPCHSMMWISYGISADMSSNHYVRLTQPFVPRARDNWARSDHGHTGYMDKFFCETSAYIHEAAVERSISEENKAKEQPEGAKRKYFSSILIFLVIGLCIYVIFKRKPKESGKEVDTFRVALLGFSLISIIVSTFFIGYFMYRSIANYQESLLGHQEILPGMYSIDQYDVRAASMVAVLIFILPLTISFVLWYVMPSIIKRWNALKPLPSEYSYVYDRVQKIASKMGISPPIVLYTQKNIVNCFNLGKREGESALVISNWLLTHLNPDELEAVLAHEMAHTKNRDVTLMAYFAVAQRILFLFPVLVLFIFLYSFLHFGYPTLPVVLSPLFWGPFIVFFVIYSLLVLGIQWFSRLREATADARASLFVDKTILKRVLYKFAGRRSMRIPFASSCLMMSDNRRFGSIFSTHPPLHKRYGMLDQKKYIIDYEKSPSLRFCFITALSIFVLLQLINYIFSALVLSITGDLPHGMLVYVFNPVIIATLFVLYYGYLSRKYVGVIILLIALLQFIVFIVLGVPSFLFAKYVLLPAAESVPSEMSNIMSYVVDLVENFSETIKMFLLTDILLFSLITFLLVVLLNYVKHVCKKENENIPKR